MFEKYMLYAVLGGILAVILLVPIVNSISAHISKMRNLERTDEYYSNNYLTKNGGTSLFYPPNWDKKTQGEHFNYLLKSFDGGKIWYAIDKDKWWNDKEIVILGNANDIYPGLLEHLDGWDKITKHVTKNGPIGLSDEEGLGLFSKVGVSINKK